MGIEWIFDIVKELMLDDIREKRWQVGTAQYHHTPMSKEGGTAMRRAIESVIRKLDSAERQLEGKEDIDRDEEDGIMRVINT